MTTRLESFDVNAWNEIFNLLDIPKGDWFEQSNTGEEHKILTVCQGGTCRSVCAAFILKYKYMGVDVLSISLERNTSETLNMLCLWADYIVVMDQKLAKVIPETWWSKIKVCHVGSDKWANPLNLELLSKTHNILQEVLKDTDVLNEPRSSADGI